MLHDVVGKGSERGGEGEILNNVLHARHGGTLYFSFSWQITGV